MAKDYSVVRNCVKHRPEKSPSSRFQPTKLFALSLKTNSFHNLSFLPFFFPFWLFTFIFISSPCASHWNLEFFWFTQTSFFVHQKNSRFQCSALRFTDKTYSSQPKLQEKCLKTHVVQWICFPGNAKYFVGWKRLEKNHFIQTSVSYILPYYYLLQWNTFKFQQSTTLFAFCTRLRHGFSKNWPNYYVMVLF